MVKCLSCASRNPGCFVPAPVFLYSKWGPGNRDSSSILDSRLRRNDTQGLARQKRRVTPFDQRVTQKTSVTI